MSWLLCRNKSIELLEPYEGKLSCTVLRGERGSDALDLPDYLPNANDTIAGEPQCWASFNGARLSAAIDGVTDDLSEAVLYTHTGNKGRTGNTEDGNMPWNIIIDLGDYYELSRIVTHQRRQNGNPFSRGYYFFGENIGRFDIYYHY
jgi:hypothetical protein